VAARQVISSLHCGNKLEIASECRAIERWWRFRWRHNYVSSVHA